MNRKQAYLWSSKVLMGLLIVGMSCLLFACSEDAEQEVLQEENTLELLPYSQSYRSEDDLGTRAVSLGGYTPYTEAPITAYMTTSPSDPSESSAARATFRYNSTKERWTSGFKIQENEIYYIYGFTPSAAVTGSSISSSNYSTGALLTLEGIEAISAQDLCIIVGVMDVDPNSLDLNNIELPTEFTLGNYKYVGKIKNSNYAYMLLHHLYGALSFTIKIDPTYNQLRTIKLKKMEMKAAAATYTASITMKRSETEPMTQSWQRMAETAANLTFGEYEGLTLTTAAQNLTLKINTEETDKIMVLPAPSNVESLVLICTYDVYDKEGHLIREDCTAENKLPGDFVKQGEWRKVNLTVNPTYLYVLSDPDLDNPTFIVEN